MYRSNNIPATKRLAVALIGTALFTFATAAMSAELECVTLGKGKKGLAYPINALAKQMTEEHGVKTCNRSDFFEYAVKKAGHTIKIRKATEAEKTAVYEAKLKGE